MIDPALRAALAAFDDAALATLANPGLVRRAHRDLEEGKVRLTASAGAEVVIEADGQAVTMDARGPRAASCACRSIPVCRHRIAAVLFVQSWAGEAAAEAAKTEEAPPADQADPAEIVLGLSLSALERWAGKASWRAALELAPTASKVEGTPQAVLVHFPDLDGPVRVLRGQGFDGIVSKASKARIKACHAAAVLAARLHFGAEAPAPREDEEDSAAASPVAIDPAFVARVGEALGEVAAMGFNLAPLPLEESLFELSVSSRADALPRLAALLRVIAAQMRLRRVRALDFDPDRMLELTASAWALTRALPVADEDRRAVLAGKLRRDYAASGPLHLVGCGGERWQAITGARGVTAWFIEPESGQWLSTSLARGPGQDPGFAPRLAWDQQSLWQAGPLARLAHARIDLVDARRSADGRLSAPAAARASIVDPAARPDPAWPGVIHMWRDLVPSWLAQTGLGLHSVETSAACLLAPSASAMPWFDEMAQQLIWPLRDAGGEWLALSLDHEEPVSPAIAALEANLKAGWQGMVLAGMRRVGDRLELRPITLFGPGDPIDLSLWQQPWRAKPDLPSMRDWLARLRAPSNRNLAPRPRSETDRALALAWRHLLDRAELGPALAHSLGAEGEKEAARLESLGLPGLADLLRGGEGTNLLRAAYALLLARQQRPGLPLLG